MPRSAIVGAVMMGFVVGCGDAATGADAGMEAGVDAWWAEMSVDAAAMLDAAVDGAAAVGVAPEPVSTGQAIPSCPAPVSGADGGVLCLNVPPGDYVLTLHKAGVRFTQVSIHGRAGVLVNAAPPWGLRAL